MSLEKHINKKFLKSLQKGDRMAQKKLFELYKVKFYGVCRLYSKTKEDAEDQLQEGFIKIFKDIAKFKGQGSIEGWMRRVMVNCCLMHIRSNKNKLSTEIDLDSIADAIEIKHPNLEKDRANAVLYLIQQLPLINQTIFNLRVMDGYKFNEIAKQLELKESTVRSHFLRARKKLQVMLNKSLIE